MTTVTMRRIDGNSVTLDGSAVESLKAELRGSLLFPGEDGYDASRTVWNSMIDRRPALVVHCAGVNDIKQAVDFARAHGLLTSVKGGGHNIAGSAVCDGGLLIDLSGMRSVRIDPGHTWRMSSPERPSGTSMPRRRPLDLLPRSASTQRPVLPVSRSGEVSDGSRANMA